MDDLALQAWLESAVRRFQENNAALVPATETLLQSVIRQPEVHARFLNALSLLEHMGSCKIMATQHGAAIDQPTLKHLAEETRHAFFFKRKAEQMARRPLAYVGGDLLSPVTTRAYFQRLEATMKRSFAPGAHGRAIYLHMSLVVEFRAVWGYRLYQQVLDQQGSGLSLKGLLAEEQGHLIDMVRRIEQIEALQMDRLLEFCGVEQRLYARMLDGFASAIGRRQAA